MRSLGQLRLDAEDAATAAAPSPVASFARVAVVIPCFKVCDRILSVIERVGPEVEAIYVVDDACPEGSGKLVEAATRDPRVHVVYNSVNEGVGGATLRGMERASRSGADVIVKIDGDGQMDPALIGRFAAPIARGEADYTKGNRFFEPEALASMPLSRLIGNAALSFLAKISTGYWHTFDPTNGFVAIHGSIVALLPTEKIAKRYFFESDLLFRLNTIGAKVVDVPMYAHYSGEESNMKPFREIPRFAAAHMRNFWKRISYNYFIRNFSIASLELGLGAILCTFGATYGIYHWSEEAMASPGTVMLAALPVIVGAQLVLAFLNYDIQSVPSLALHPRMRNSMQTMRSLRHRDGK